MILSNSLSIDCNLVNNIVVKYPFYVLNKLKFRFYKRCTHKNYRLSFLIENLYKRKLYLEIYPIKV